MKVRREKTEEEEIEVGMLVLPEQVLVQVMEAEEVFATGGLKWYWLGTVHSHKKMSSGAECCAEEYK